MMGESVLLAGRRWDVETAHDGPGATFSFSIPSATEGLSRADSIRDTRTPAVTDADAA